MGHSLLFSNMTILSSLLILTIFSGLTINERWHRNRRSSARSTSEIPVSYTHLYEILPDGNWYSFVKDGQRYYISYSDVGH